jgi:acetylornithine deacetylase/succinyl-diaminopimelate desuccinylase-like protein
MNEPLACRSELKITFMNSSSDAAGQSGSAQVTQSVKDEVAHQFAARIADLCSLVRIPGIAWDAFDPAHLQASAEKVRELLIELDLFELVEIRTAKYGDKTGAPAVVARRAAKNGKPQILLYAHHDVQPPGLEGDWNTPAFEPTIKDGRIFARGAADDKAGIVAHLTALRVLKQILGEDFEVGVSVFIEGEEEAGSPSFRNFLEENKDALEADVIVVADSANWTVEVPALTTTLRGLVSQVIEVRTLDHAVHSGMYGGAIPDATMALIRVLASLHNEDGSVAVQGLVESEAAALEYTEESLRVDSGLLPATHSIGKGTFLSRIWTKPSITVIGIDTTPVAISSNTLLPSASAKISMRIAPGDDPATALEKLRTHLTDNLPWGASIAFGETELGKPFASDTDGWAFKLAKDALSEAFSRESVEIGIGGSIPFIADLTEVFPSAQILVTGVEEPDSRAHSPNESVHLETLRGAMVAEALMLIAANAHSLNK